jgi:hypothetical protein
VAFAEVDLPWMALVVAATRPMPGWAAAALLGFAVTVSPTAALAAPWVAVERADRRVLMGPFLAIMALGLASEGGWWSGERGVFHAPLLPGRTAAAWLGSGVWAAMLIVRDRRLAALAPLLLAPPDVPGWVLFGVAAARRWPAGGFARGLAIAAVVAGLWGLGERRARVAAEDRVIRSVVAAWRPGQVIEAPWSWGARWSVNATGDVYSGRWVAIPPVRDQSVCPGTSLGRLPPGRGPAITIDERGVGWSPLSCDSP